MPGFYLPGRGIGFISDTAFMLDPFFGAEFPRNDSLLCPPPKRGPAVSRGKLQKVSPLWRQSRGFTAAVRAKNIAGEYGGFDE